LCEQLNIAHETDAPIGADTWYGVGGRAALLAKPARVEQLAELVACCNAHDVPIHMLGSGANLLIGDRGVGGLVVTFTTGELAGVTFDETRVIAAAGFDLMKLVSLTATRGLDGLSGLAGIPASVGGAVRMNAGGAYGDTGERIRRVRVMDADGRVSDLDASDITFAYRHTSIGAAFILEAEFALSPADADVVRDRVKQIMAWKKGTQPMGASSAGCTWKNPTPPQRYRSPGDATMDDNDPHGWPAGMLVDRAGLKGFAVGGARISPHHANFIECQQHATASDVLAVMAHAEATVQQQFDVTLQREVVVWD